MSPLCVVFLSGKLPPDALDAAAEALQNRGFEVFASKPISGQAAQMVPGEYVREGRALVAFNSLMTATSGNGDRSFADFEVEKAAHLLATSLPDPREHLRVTEDAVLAEKLAKGLLTEPEYEQMQVTIASRQADMATDLPVLADLSRFKYRAKVELVEWNGKKAVKKTFRSTALDAMARELAFCDDVAPHSDVPPRVLDRTENAIIFEHIDNCLKVRRLFGLRLPIPLGLKHVRELADFIRLVVARGWDPIDLTPRDNILIDANTGGLRAIDFEFAHRRTQPVRAEESFFLAGVPVETKVARPLNLAMTEDPYPGKWRAFTGLGKHSFLYGPKWRQSIERCLVHPVWLVLRVSGALMRQRQHATARDELLHAVVIRAE